jgi:hypothetical protein
LSIAAVRLYICHPEELLRGRSAEEARERERGSEESKDCEGNRETEGKES